MRNGRELYIIDRIHLEIGGCHDESFDKSIRV